MRNSSLATKTMLQTSDYILIIEDSKAETHLLLQTLKMHQFSAHIEVLHSGQSAIEKISDKEDKLPKLVLLDLRLNDIDGIEILTYLKNDPDYQQIPVIIRTGSNDPRDKKTALQLGVMDYMIKSMEFESVEQQVLKLIKYWEKIS